MREWGVQFVLALRDLSIQDIRTAAGKVGAEVQLDTEMFSEPLAFINIVSNHPARLGKRSQAFTANLSRRLGRPLEGWQEYDASKEPATD